MTPDASCERTENTNRRVTCIGGVPGSGKTTLVRALLQSVDGWQIVRPTRLLRALYHPERDTYVLGVYDDGVVFAGTDRLSMAVQPEVLPWIQSHTSNVVFEGDRLFTPSLIQALRQIPETVVDIVVLQASQKCLDERYQSRQSQQSDRFLKSRHTKIQRMIDQFQPRRVNTHSSSVDEILAIVFPHNGR